MDPAALLALIGELYSSVGRLTAENEQLRAELARRTPKEPEKP